MTEVSSDVLDSFRELGTTHVNDALDRPRLPGQCLGIAPLDHSFRLVGRAYTHHPLRAPTTH